MLVKAEGGLVRTTSLRRGKIPAFLMATYDDVGWARLRKSETLDNPRVISLTIGRFPRMLWKESTFFTSYVSCGTQMG